MPSEQEAIQRLRDALVRLHGRAAVHDEDGLHMAAHDISQGDTYHSERCPQT